MIKKLLGIAPSLNKDGSLKANIDSRFTVDQIKQAVTRAWEDGRNGKVLIVSTSLL